MRMDIEDVGIGEGKDSSAGDVHQSQSSSPPSHPFHRRSQLVDGQGFAGSFGKNGQRCLAREHLVNVLPLPLECPPMDHVHMILRYETKRKWRRENGVRTKVKVNEIINRLVMSCCQIMRQAKASTYMLECTNRMLLLDRIIFAITSLYLVEGALVAS